MVELVRVPSLDMGPELVRQPKTVRLDRELHAHLKAKAALAGMTIEAYLEQIVREHVEAP